MGLGNELLLTLLICSWGTGIKGHFLELQRCPFNAEMCSWNYIEDDSTGDPFCYKYYAHPDSAKDYECSVAQCEAMSQVACTGDIFSANEALLNIVLGDTNLTDGSYYFNMEPGSTPAIVEISDRSVQSITNTPSEEELMIKRGFICKSCGLAEVTTPPPPICPKCCIPPPTFSSISVPPITSSLPPVPTSKAPLTSSKAPILTSSKAPILTSSKAPILTSSKAPILTSSKAPILTSSKAPILTSSKAPILTSSKAPIMTSSKAPVVPSRAPIVTSKAPQMFSFANFATSKAPPAPISIPPSYFQPFIATSGGAGGDGTPTNPHFYSGKGEYCDSVFPLAAGPNSPNGFYFPGFSGTTDDTLFVRSGGGTTGPAMPTGTETDETWFYDVRSPSAGWVQAGSLNTPREGHCQIPYTTSSGVDQIYALGGYSNSQPQDSIEIFDPVSKTWSTSALVIPNGGGSMECVQSCDDMNCYFAILDDGYLYKITMSDAGPMFELMDTTNPTLNPQGLHVYIDPSDGVSKVGYFGSLGDFQDQHISHEADNIFGTRETNILSGGNIVTDSIDVAPNCEDRRIGPRFYATDDSAEGGGRVLEWTMDLLSGEWIANAHFPESVLHPNLGSTDYRVTSDNTIFHLAQHECVWDAAVPSMPPVME